MTRSSRLRGFTILPSDNQQRDDQCTVCTQESICEPPRPYEGAVTRVRRARPALFMLSLLIAAPAILVVLVSTRSDLHLSRADPQPVLYHRSYGWRGPGVYFVSGDYRIKEQGFIRHEGTVAEGTVVVAFSPY